MINKIERFDPLKARKTFKRRLYGLYCAISGDEKKVQVGKDQEKAQSEKDSHSKHRGGKKTKPTIRYLYHETYRKPNEQLFSKGGKDQIFIWP